jgi:hypothetical protein
MLHRPLHPPQRVDGGYGGHRQRQLGHREEQRVLDRTSRAGQQFLYLVYIAANGGANAFDSSNAYDDDISWLVTSPWTS